MCDFTVSCWERYLELTGKSEKDLEPGRGFLYPGIDDSMLKTEDWETEGVLKSISSKVLMKILYGARTCRWDLLHAVNSPAREVTKWNKNCDVRLHKLMCYIKQSSQHCLEAWIGDPPDKLKFVAWCDADFAGDVRASKSTSGAYLALVGPNSFFPVSSLCKKQSVVSLSFKHRKRNRQPRGRAQNRSTPNSYILGYSL